ncbi:hypothetical protein [Streptomyces californicus]|uniref:hypothetical protein n=1 Tax=Streptomyces californicus TaxID=67351 RepID=UPI0033B0E6C7
MIIVYTPDGGEREEYDARTLKVSEASIAQRTIDQKWEEIKSGLLRDDIDAMRVIVWLLKKRTQPALRFSEVDPGVEEMRALFDRQETDNYITNAVASVMGMPDVTPEDIAHALRELPDVCADREYAEQLIAEKTTAPKAPDPGPVQATESETAGGNPTPTSSTPEPSTSDSSPTS